MRNTHFSRTVISQRYVWLKIEFSHLSFRDGAHFPEIQCGGVGGLQYQGRSVGGVFSTCSLPFVSQVYSEALLLCWFWDILVNGRDKRWRCSTVSFLKDTASCSLPPLPHAASRGGISLRNGCFSNRTHAESCLGNNTSWLFLQLDRHIYVFHTFFCWWGLFKSLVAWVHAYMCCDPVLLSCPSFSGCSRI